VRLCVCVKVATEGVQDAHKVVEAAQACVDLFRHGIHLCQGQAVDHQLIADEKALDQTCQRRYAYNMVSSACA
jgi:hypothetical protein